MISELLPIEDEEATKDVGWLGERVDEWVLTSLELGIEVSFETFCLEEIIFVCSSPWDSSSRGERMGSWFRLIALEVKSSEMGSLECCSLEYCSLECCSLCKEIDSTSTTTFQTLDEAF